MKSKRQRVEETDRAGSRRRGTGRACRARKLGVLLGLAVVALAAPSLAAAEPAPFGHACKLQHGVRFCPTETLEQRVPSFDNVPLDVDVTLPATGTGPFPTIVALHGWGTGNSKTSYEATTPEGDGGAGFHNNNIYYAEHGYAFVTYSARGWERSWRHRSIARTHPRLRKRVDSPGRRALRGA